MSPAEAAELLGVAPDAGIPEIQHAFTREARRTHPDLLGDLAEADRKAANARFAELREARDVLLQTKPVHRVDVVQDGPVFRPVPGRGIGRSVIALILLALILVAAVTAQDAYRSSFVEQLRGGTVEQP